MGYEPGQFTADDAEQLTPTTSIYSCHLTRLVRVCSMEFTNEGGIRNLFAGYPAALHRPVSLPVPQTLQAVAQAAHVKEDCQ